MKAKTTQLSITFKTFVTLIAFLTLTTLTLAQSGGVVISTNPDAKADSSAILDVQSNSQGVLIPRMTTEQMLNIQSPAKGLMVYNSTDSVIYLFTGTNWERLNHFRYNTVDSVFYLTVENDTMLKIVYHWKYNRLVLLGSYPRIKIISNSKDGKAGFVLQNNYGDADTAYTFWRIGKLYDTIHDYLYFMYYDGDQYKYVKHVYLDKTGKVGIGVEPQARLHIVGISGDQNSAIIGSYAGAFKDDWPSGWGGGLATWDVCGASTYFGSYYTRSKSLNLKSSKSMTKGLGDILALAPITYSSKDDYQKVHYGIEPKSLQKQFPELITTSTKGNYVINYMELIPVLVKTVQDQQKQIDLLQQQVTELKKQNELLLKLLNQQDK